MTDDVNPDALTILVKACLNEGHSPDAVSTCFICQALAWVVQHGPSEAAAEILDP